jgi:hypothetical protein
MRDISEDFQAAAISGIVLPAYFIDLVFDEGVLRFWTGYGTIEWNGNTYTGGGNLLALELAEETQEMEATSATFTLNGAPEEILSIALLSEYGGRPARVWLALLRGNGEVGHLTDNDGDDIRDNDGALIHDNLTTVDRRIIDNEDDPLLDNDGRPILSNRLVFGVSEIIGDPIRVFSGRMDVMPILDDPARPVIQLTTESDLGLLSKSSERRYTHEDQQLDYPGDRFFEYVTTLQDQDIIWGTK